MNPSDIFKKHFGDRAVVSMFDPRIESFFKELDAHYRQGVIHKQPSRGDRILISNVPADDPCRNIYLTDGRYMGVIDHTNPEDETILFMTGYIPYMDDENYTCSGGIFSIKTDKLRFRDRGPATFWRFKKGEPQDFDGENYEMEVNYFDCEFEDIK